jgi:hypothetical protein
VKNRKKLKLYALQLKVEKQNQEKVRKGEKESLGWARNW